jgi:hypothetical protein
MKVKISNVISLTLMLLIVAFVVCIISIDKYEAERNDKYVVFRSLEHTAVGTDWTEMKEGLKSGPSVHVRDNLADFTP